MLRYPHDVHTHTTYSDGKGSVLENVEAAEERKLRLLGISDHVNFFTEKTLLKYVKEIKSVDSDVVVLAGIEANIVPGGSDLTDSFRRKLDYAIASVHTFVSTPEEYARLVWDALLDDNVDIIGHFGASFNYVGNPEERILSELIRLAEEKGKAFEISGWYRTPSLEFVRECVKRGVKLSFGSDAHRPKRVGDVSWSDKVFLKAGGRKEDLFFSDFL